MDGAGSRDGVRDQDLARLPCMYGREGGGSRGRQIAGVHICSLLQGVCCGGLGCRAQGRGWRAEKGSGISFNVYGSGFDVWGVGCRIRGHVVESASPAG